jgi:hypothetical protein
MSTTVPELTWYYAAQLVLGGRFLKTHMSDGDVLPAQVGVRVHKERDAVEGHLVPPCLLESKLNLSPTLSARRPNEMLAPFDSTSCLSPGQESEPCSPVSKLEGEEESGSHHLTDVERLRMLGYDAALSRPLGFWSSAAMTLCHMSFVYDFIALAGCYAYDGPLLFVSSRGWQSG